MRPSMPAFTGSYPFNDVQFLLKPIQIDDTPIHLKEQLIQSGQKHYSQLLSHEALPKPEYEQLFHEALAFNQQRLAKHLLILAQRIIDIRSNDITLISLARAGTPIGVLLKRILKQYFQRDVNHYSMSIVRDIGLDLNALRFVLQRHSPESLVFIDGWTGKGVISQQLATSLAAFAKTDAVDIPAELYVLTDLSGSAAVSASCDDYLIPSSILNATVSGLISRSVYHPESVANGDFHGCVYYQQFAEHDLSNYFVDVILASVEQVWQQYSGQLPQPDINRQALQQASQQLQQQLQQQYSVSHSHYIKPGIGESTRVLLRREARCLLLREAKTEATRHLRWLAEHKSIPITIIPDLPYQAVALIKELSS